MKYLLETKKYTIFYNQNPISLFGSRQLALRGCLFNNDTEEIIDHYETWEKNYITTLENLGKKLYKIAKRIK